MTRLLVGWATLTGAAPAIFLAGPAAACSICLSAVDIAPGERLDLSDRAVIAVPDGRGGWQIAESIKGTGPVAPSALANTLQAGGDEAVLFIRDGLGQRWSALGEVDVHNADWLRRLAEAPAPEMSEADHAAEVWRPRLDLVMRRLDSDDPQIEAIAHGDLARAPYAAILAVGRTLTTEQVLEHLAREAHPAHRAAYIHMLGATADEAALAWIDAGIATASEAGDAGDLAALLAADIEIRGAPRIGWIVERYFLDRKRGLDEIEAALMALRVHGEAGTALPRNDVVAAYTRFIEVRPQMAGFVATDLAAWEAWDATAEYVALLNADAIADPAGAFAALSYVQRSPDAAATSRLEPPDG